MWECSKGFGIGVGGEYLFFFCCAVHAVSMLSTIKVVVLIFYLFAVDMFYYNRDSNRKLRLMFQEGRS